MQSRTIPISRNSGLQSATSKIRKPSLRERKRIAWVLEQLEELYPDAECELNYGSPFELLVATILSAQCTDVRVNLVTPELFRRFSGPEAFANADIAEIEALIRSTGFFHNKATAIQSASRQLMAEHQGTVPNDLQALTALKGVGRKTASVVMGNAFGRADGIVVDTHVARLSQRLRLSRQTQPEKIELDLMTLVPAENWVQFPHWMIAHGRRVCKARKPLCSECPLALHCPGREPV